MSLGRKILFLLAYALLTFLYAVPVQAIAAALEYLGKKAVLVSVALINHKHQIWLKHIKPWVDQVESG